MIDIVLTLVFSIVMLLFMAYPAKILTDAMAAKFDFSPQTHTVVLLSVTILLALGVGLFLRFA